MNFLRNIFGPPNIEKLKEEGNVRALARILLKGEYEQQVAAAQALGIISENGNNGIQAIRALAQVLFREEQALSEVAANSLEDIHSKPASSNPWISIDTIMEFYSSSENLERAKDILKKLLISEKTNLSSSIWAELQKEEWSNRGVFNIGVMSRHSINRR